MTVPKWKCIIERGRNVRFRHLWFSHSDIMRWVDSEIMFRGDWDMISESTHLMMSEWENHECLTLTFLPLSLYTFTLALSWHPHLMAHHLSILKRHHIAYLPYIATNWSHRVCEYYISYSYSHPHHCPRWVGFGPSHCHLAMDSEDPSCHVSIAVC